MRRLLEAVGRPIKLLSLACVVIAAVVGFGAPVDAQAQSVRIVALGASNTNGKGVSRSQAYPAHLQALLKQKGVDGVVTNAGIDGDTTGGMLARLGSAVPAGTQVVILQPGGNDKRRGQEGQRAGNIAKIRSQLVARGVKVIVMENDAFRAVPQSERAADGQHFTPRGYAILAQNILPQVLAAVGK
ncbi:MAG: esterase [Hyphomicrobiaceae bacterium]|nr:MAG: esterase [Hyphomicrobiaceae bacterium]